MSLLVESFWFDTVLGAVTLLSILYYLWTLNYNYWKDRNVPYLEPSFPFGNTKDFLLSKRFSGYVFKDLYFQLKGHKYGGIINMRKPQLILRDPEIIKLILTKDFKYFTDRGTSIDEKVDPLLAHLFHLTGERWHSLRVKLTPTFTSGKMKMMFHLMKTCANLLDESLIRHAEKEGVIDLKDFMARYGIDVIGACAFGLEIDSLKNPDNEFLRISKEIFKSRLAVTIRNILNSIIPGIANAFNIKITPKEREDFFIKIVGDSVKYREANNIVRNDFLDLIIQIRNKGQLDDELSNKSETSVSSLNGNGSHMKSSSNVYMTDEQMTAQCFVFFVAGFETSSTTLSFCLYELSKHKLVQNKLQEEIDNVLTKHNYEITYDALKEMTYMDLIVQETLRKYSPLPALARTCVADYTLKEGNLKIEKGTPVVIPLYGLHYDPEYYPEPEHFDPERFTEEAKQSRPNYTWLPFGEGPRNCIGMRFGLMQVKTGLTTLLSRYNFDCVPETPIPMELSNRSILTAPSKEIKLKISKRTK